jgi:hypothetical protein
MRYESVRDPQNGLRIRLKDLAAAWVRYGYRRLHVLLLREGWEINHKRVYRIYLQEGLNLRTKRPRRRVAAKISSHDRIWLLSNAHAIAIPGVTLGVTLRNGAEMHTLHGHRPVSSDADLAIIEVSAADWEAGDRQAIEVEQFQRSHDLVAGEMCFFIGFPGAHSFTSVAERTVRSKAFPYAGQQVGPIDEWVFYMHAQLSSMHDENGEEVAPFEFGGVSGSLVWNTRIVESVRKGTNWTPGLATPAGVLRAWQPGAGRLEIVRTEHIWDLFQRGVQMLANPDEN